MKPQTKTYLQILAAAAICAALSWVGDQDYQQELDQQARYCKNVAAGIWPDYNHNAREICSNTQ